MRKQRDKKEMKHKAYFVAIGFSAVFLLVLILLFDFSDLEEKNDGPLPLSTESSLYFLPSPQQEPLVEEHYLIYKKPQPK